LEIASSLCSSQRRLREANKLSQENNRIAEVTESSSIQFTAQCYELYALPALGSLVRTRDGDIELYGVVFHASTTSLEPGRRPIARGKDEASEAAIFESNPQLAQLLKTEIGAVIVGHKNDGQYRYFLPPHPARLHGFVYACDKAEVKAFSSSFSFLNILLTRALDVSPEELVAATLREMSQSHDDKRVFMVGAGKELAALLAAEYGRLKVILERLK